MRGNLPALGPFENGAGLDFQVLGGLRRGEPFGFHIETPIFIG